MRQRFWQGTFKTLGLLGLTAGLAAEPRPALQL
ncbi:hypothetical protein K3Z90_21360, partial [Pseudomonas aeruginosa]|nr:hypothetical protein [Pseudomonas aeruginosa]